MNRLKELRKEKKLTQKELAEKTDIPYRTLQRWENGETVPNTETLKLLSKVFDVSINTLLGSPRKLICQCCGMPLEDDDIIDMMVKKGVPKSKANKILKYNKILFNL